jgi:hypothetical protein
VFRFSRRTYSVVPSPAKETPSEILSEYEARKINLDALFDGKSPFEGEVAAS